MRDYIVPKGQRIRIPSGSMRTQTLKDGTSVFYNKALDLWIFIKVVPKGFRVVEKFQSELGSCGNCEED